MLPCPPVVAVVGEEREMSFTVHGRMVVATGVAMMAALAAAAMAAAPSASAASCKQPQAKYEPPCNPALPNSPWGQSHRGSYAQHSAAVAGIDPRKGVETQHVFIQGAPIVLDFTGKYDDGGRAVWGSLIGSPDRRGVFKLDHQTGKLIDVYYPDEREANPPPVSATTGITGSYNLLTKQNNFVVPRKRDVEFYGDSDVGKKGSKKRRFSPITLVKRFEAPDSVFCRDNDSFVGATMTYDGTIVLATAQGQMVAIPAKPDQVSADSVRVLSLNGAACDNPSVSDDDLEQVSNSISADEKGGVYVVTSKLMRKVQWDKKSRELTSAWSAPYDTGSSGGGEIRL